MVGYHRRFLYSPPARVAYRMRTVLQGEEGGAICGGLRSVWHEMVEGRGSRDDVMEVCLALFLDLFLFFFCFVFSGPGSGTRIGDIGY